MIDRAGRALTAIASGGEGRVATHGEIWSATAAEPIAEGDRVQVVAVNGLTLTVRRAAQSLHAGDDKWTSHR
jgi:membrane-bound serine protease (ClpP class)